MLLKLLMVSSVPSTLTAFLLPYAEHFRRLGWRVDALTRDGSGCERCLNTFDNVWDVAWSRNPLKPQNLLEAPQTIHELIARQGYDIVHVHDPVAAFVTRFALRRLEHPQVFYTAHGFHFFKGNHLLKNALFLTLERLAGRWTDHLIVINREDEAAAKRYRLVPEGQLHYLPGIGVDTAAYSAAQVTAEEVEAVRASLGLRGEDPLFLLVAEFNPGKRHRDALRALAKLPHPRAALAFAGVGPLLEATKQLASELGIAERVHFLGYRHDIPVLLRAASALLLPSEREGLPRSIMEAMAMGTPVIATPIRGVSELLAESCGLLHPVGDVDELARAMAWIIANPHEAGALAERAKVRVARYDLKPLLAAHEVLYQQALTRSQTSAMFKDSIP
ncbi:MAG: glycosyltransferase [Truepera sp.]|nr:glycosyltransferase [Truepera sp.]